MFVLRVSSFVNTRFAARGALAEQALVKIKPRKKPRLASFYNLGNTPKRYVSLDAAMRLPNFKALYGGREIVVRSILEEIAKNPYVAVADLAVTIPKKLNAEGVIVKTINAKAVNSRATGMAVTPGLIRRLMEILEKEKILINVRAKKRPAKK